jgi:NTE family protein
MPHELKIGIALGGGAARGWAHIGVLQGLRRIGIEPAVVTGASIGALVGAAYAGDRLSALERWVRGLSRLDVLKLLDARLAGGVIEGNRVMHAVEAILPDQPIESLPRPFAAVATDLSSGRAVWLRSGSTLAAIRASCAMPGLMPPRFLDERWLVDGGLVDPVPVTLCRVLGAELVIAVDLSAHNYRHNQIGTSGRTGARADAAASVRATSATHEIGTYLERLQAFVGDWLDSGATPQRVEPGLFDVVSASINIMQERITRSRLAGDPPELELTPALEDIGMMDFHKAAQAIQAGIAVVESRGHALAALRRSG